MRTYICLIIHNGFYLNWPGDVIHTTKRIRQAVIDEFFEAFGIMPDFHWHKDGLLAAAYSSEEDFSYFGRCVEIEPVSHKHASYAPNWILHNGAAHPYRGPEKQLTEAA